MILTTSLIKQASKSNDELDFTSLVFKIILSGKVDKMDSINFWIFIKTLIDGGSLKIILDMSELDIIDSKGIGKIIGLVQLIRANSGDMVLINKSEFIKEIFISLNMQEFITVFASEKDAVQYFYSSGT
jgi:anti-anti-sigma factor